MYLDTSLFQNETVALVRNDTFRRSLFEMVYFINPLLTATFLSAITMTGYNGAEIKVHLFLRVVKQR